jgi:hypothetical protein
MGSDDGAVVQAGGVEGTVAVVAEAQGGVGGGVQLHSSIAKIIGQFTQVKMVLESTYGEQRAFMGCTAAFINDGNCKGRESVS